jgi:hypothetical protein
VNAKLALSGLALAVIPIFGGIPLRDDASLLTIKNVPDYV